LKGGACRIAGQFCHPVAELRSPPYFTFSGENPKQLKNNGFFIYFAARKGRQSGRFVIVLRLVHGSGRRPASAQQSGPWRGVETERYLKLHKFRVGEIVKLTTSNVARPAAGNTFEVVRLMPTDGEDCQYRIKHENEAFERVARESQLSAFH